MGTTNKFKSLLPNYKESYSKPVKVKKTKTSDFKPARASYRDAELAMEREPFQKTKDLFKRRAKKKDQSR